MKIAVVGSGISGLTLAHYLGKKHQITLFEKDNRVGGHTHTHSIKIDNKKINVDSGFIVFNKKTYPNFLKLIKELDVPFQKSSMSFSVQSKLNGLEYNGNNFNTLFSQRKNIFNVRFWIMIWEILKFNRLGKKLLKTPASQIKNITIEEFLSTYNFSNYFMTNYLLPMTSAIWSSSFKDVKKFSLLFFLRFLNNHGMININDRPQWLTIKNGSKTYVDQIIKKLNGSIILNANIQSIIKNGKKCIVQTKKKNYSFDHVFFACHADQALKLIKKPTSIQKKILGQFAYAKNSALLHRDLSLMPNNKRAWAAWNYHIDKKLVSDVTVTYNMNILQNIKTKSDLMVSLNIDNKINNKKILKK
jgi:predicted NAD/FAD-binding protein